MATNFTLCMPVEASQLGNRQPVLEGDYVESIDQAPTGGWVEVALTAKLGEMAGRGVKKALVHISTDAALRYKVADAVPGAVAGAQVLAGFERTIGVATGSKLWIK